MTLALHDAGSTVAAVELRKARRLDTRLEAVLLTAHGEVRGMVVNISRTGLCLESNKALADLLLASLGQASGNAPVIVTVRFDVPDGSPATAPVTAQARTVYVLHDHADVYRCGLEFRLFTAGGQAFEKYLGEHVSAD